jgi:threonine 3-dehydrogenase
MNWRDYEEGFAVMRSGNSGKVILDWRDVASSGS